MQGVAANVRPQQGFLPASAAAFAQCEAGGADAGVSSLFVVPGPEKAAGVT